MQILLFMWILVKNTNISYGNATALQMCRLKNIFLLEGLFLKNKTKTNSFMP